MTGHPMHEHQALARGTVVIDVEACKGCDLCIDACRPGVLRMTTTTFNSRGFRYPELLPGCTACRACAQICPDFVFQVWKYDEPLALAWEDGDDTVRTREPSPGDPSPGRQDDRGEQA